MSHKLKAALIGGALLLVLALLTLLVRLPFTRVLCCVWALVGGMIAVFIYNRSSARSASAGDGAILGALAGLIGGIPAVVPMLMQMNNPAVQSQLEDRLRASGYEQMPVSMAALLIIVGVIFVLTMTALTTVGGIIGASLFSKPAGGDTGTPTPPSPTPPRPVPPPDFSNT